MKIDIPVRILSDCASFGGLYWSDDPDEMTEAMLDIRLPNGLLVCAGWCSTEDAYLITVSLHGRLIIPPAYTISPLEARDHIVERVLGYKGRNLSVSDSDTDDTERVVRCDPATNRLVVVEAAA